MNTINRLRIRLHKGDDGIAMVLVISISLILMMMITVALSSTLSGVTKSRSDENWNGAIAAAYAGIEDYRSKIADDNRYYLFGNPLSSYSAANVPASVLPTGTAANPAFGLGATGPWKQVSSSVGAFYRYEVDTTSYNSTGVLRVRSTGKVGDETRSVVANLKPKGFIDFLYYTTYEIQDPVISGANAANCTKYAWAGRGNGSSCGELSFGVNDTINGPTHSNDTIRACGSTFAGAVTTGYKPTGTNPTYLRMDSNANACGGGTSETFTKGKPVWTGTLDLPPTNAKMRNEVRTDLADVQYPGCLYTGPTSIVFNSTGTVTIRSPWTKKTRVAGDPVTSGTDPAECGTPGVTGLGSATGQTFTLPPKNLVFVQNVTVIPTSSTSTDPNVWKSGVYPSGITAGTCAAGNNIGYPATGETNINVATAYGCFNGDLFVKGDVNAETTLVAENYVYVTGDIKYVASNPTAILGLVAQNSVLVYNPMKNCSSTCQSILGGTNRRIDAAILSVKHTFTVQNYNVGGDRGTLTVNGAIAQLFRGAVRSSSGSTINGGYAKNYVYEWRLQSVAPPKFLSPVSTTYQVREVVEVKTAFNPNGSPS